MADIWLKKNSKYGDFYGCTYFPYCKNTINIDQNRFQGEEVEVSQFLNDLPKHNKNTSSYNSAIRKKTNVQIADRINRSNEVVHAWICTNTNCTAWERVTPYNESQIRKCPLCRSVMRKGSKIIN